MELRASGSFESERQSHGEQDRSSDLLRPATSNCARGLIWPAVGTTILFRDILLNCSWQTNSLELVYHRLPGYCFCVTVSRPCGVLPTNRQPTYAFTAV